MKNIIYLIFSIFLLAACSSKEEAKIDTSKARAMGEKAAQEMIDSRSDTVLLQTLLLDARATQYKILQRNDTVIADTYVQAIEDYLRAHHDSLARAIL
ncbi:MAG: hypothetical protein LUC85_05565 [Bacteroidales bacterium]|nr:hypothetical protein [Bacteroidales bacterium]